MIRFLVIALLLYIAWRVVRHDLKRFLGRRPPSSGTIAVDTVRCPRCGAYGPVGVKCSCDA